MTLPKPICYEIATAGRNRFKDSQAGLGLGASDGEAREKLGDRGASPSPKAQPQPMYMCMQVEKLVSWKGREGRRGGEAEGRRDGETV